MSIPETYFAHAGWYTVVCHAFGALTLPYYAFRLLGWCWDHVPYRIHLVRRWGA